MLKLLRWLAWRLSLTRTWVRSHRRPHPCPAEMARLEAQSDKDMGEDDDETSSSDDGEESFVQVKKNIDDENAEAAEMARLEAQSDKDMGEDDDETSATGDDDTTGP